MNIVLELGMAGHWILSQIGIKTLNFHYWDNCDLKKLSCLLTFSSILIS